MVRPALPTILTLLRAGRRIVAIGGRIPVPPGPASVSPGGSRERAAAPGPSPTEFRVLGPLEVIVGGRDVALGGAKQRALFALLLLRANEPVSTDALIDHLWAGTPPASAAKVLQNHVLRLRRLLGDHAAGAERLVTRAPGYLLRVAPEELDAHRFAALVDAARGEREADPATAAARLREALGLWRGPALCDVADEGFAQAEIRRLEELWLHAREELIDAQLALGAHEALVPELEALVAEHPFRERLRGLLMEALYRCGRQQEALDVVRQVRSLMHQELGLEPGPELRRLEKAILDQDPGLAGPQARAVVAERAVVPRRSRVRRRRRLVVVVLACAAVAVTAAAWRAREPAGVEAYALPVDVVARLDARSGRADRIIPVGHSPTSVAVHDGAVWVANFGDGTVSRSDLASGATTTTGTGFAPTRLAAGGEVVWAIGRSDGSVLRLDAATGQALSRTTLPSGLADAAADTGAVWVTSTIAGTVTRLDARDGRATLTVRRLAGPAGVTITGGRVWVAESFGRRIAALDRRAGRVVKRVPLSHTPDDVAAGAGAIWVTHPLDDLVSRVDEHSSQTRITSVGSRPTQLAVGARAAWVINDRDNSVSKLDARTAAPEGTMSLADPGPGDPGEGPPGTPGGIAADRGALWLAVAER
jgi:DNA-binding SARP family transcriptional activator/DNA-binding beta-propeller fold protein YncE